MSWPVFFMMLQCSNYGKDLCSPYSIVFGSDRLRCISWLTKPQIAVGGFECNSVRGRCFHILAPGHELGSRFVRLTGQKTNKIQKHTMPVDTRMPVMLKHNNLCFYILQIVAQSMKQQYFISYLTLKSWVKRCFHSFIGTLRDKPPDDLGLLGP